MRAIRSAISLARRRLELEADRGVGHVRRVDRRARGGVVRGRGRGRRMRPIVAILSTIVPDDLTDVARRRRSTRRATARGLSANALAERSGRVAGDDREDRAGRGAADRRAARAAVGRAGADAVRAGRARRAGRPATASEPPSSRRGPTRRPATAAAPLARQPAGRSSSSRSSCRRAPRSPIRRTPTRSSTSRSGCSTGRLRFREGDIEHELDAGDCLQLGRRRRARSSTRGAGLPLPRRADATLRMSRASIAP